MTEKYRILCNFIFIIVVGNLDLMNIIYVKTVLHSFILTFDTNTPLFAFGRAWVRNVPFLKMTGR